MTDAVERQEKEVPADKSAVSLYLSSGIEQMKPLSGAEKLELVAKSATSGLFTSGTEHLVNHTGSFSLEMAGAATLAVAMKGPAWVKGPAYVVAAVGGLSYAKHVAEAGSETLDILAGTNRANMADSGKKLEAALGPVVFDTLAMSVAARAGGEVGGKLPEKPKLPESLANLRLPDLNLGGGPRLAMAGADIGPGYLPARHVEIRPISAKPSDNIVAMTARETGGRGAGETKVPEVISRRGARGEIEHVVERLSPGEKAQIKHSDGSVSIINQNGQVMLGFSSGQARLLDLGYPVSRVVASDYVGGVRHFRINQSSGPTIEAIDNGHIVRAMVGKGDHLHMMDNTPGGNTYFPHRDGLESWVEYNGRVVFRSQAGVVESQLPGKLAHIRLVEHKDGSKNFRFLGEDGKLLPNSLEVPPPPETSLKAQADQDYLRRLQAAIRAKADGQARGSVNGELDMNRIEPSHVVGQGRGSKDHIGSMIPRFPGSFQRAFEQQAFGIPSNILRSDNLARPDQMELVMQGHSWLETNYLNRLGKQEEY